MKYVLDTNVILAYLRKHSIWDQIEKPFGLFETGTFMYIPSIVLGELKSLAIQNKWGAQRKLELQVLVNELVPVRTITDDIIERYAEIDAFSQGRLRERQLKGSARNMGKNDLWIAATASVLNATLITTDKDFDHLNAEFLNVARFELI
ncbi:type II toxin-antitoxin system VapC family toxin [Dyadobacter sp. CY326]|uniref:type II toxin-antitoxin system VapC family toxin n=1 Tax=Dyadobacter sp. CY326 TaxID=2907300 RepID=UPI001F31106F|nr:type II toxin-antitoxin system VapC family toxin [Dyadobacter sp. CY326]MCE7064280.1 type II toxin-antitoxin system VapC family toxin [Dyadobacter sp. CY326]